MDPNKDVSWVCRFHPTDWFHEVGCPHNENWTKEELQSALESAKRTKEYHIDNINKVLNIPTKFPERESDEYDAGCEDTIKRVLKIIVYGKQNNDKKPD